MIDVEKMIGNDIIEFEQYELKLNHYYTDTNGRRVQLDEPITIAQALQLGSVANKNSILNMMIYKLQDYIKSKGWGDENDK